MNHFFSVDDVSDPILLAKEAIEIKKDPYKYQQVGENKILGLIFFNNSLRTRMSTIASAYRLGMKVIAINIGQESWQMESEEGAVMDKGKAEHLKDAIPVMSNYCDLLGVRAFPELKSQKEDYEEKIVKKFIEYSHCPIVNLESATLHPLQSLADLMTIIEHKNKEDIRKIVLTWAPNIKPLPQSVANSFSEWMLKSKLPLTITYPKGMDLAKKFTHGATINSNQNEALQNADFVYVKNWSSYSQYGHHSDDKNWMLTKDKLKTTHHAKVMHCMPIRRNVVIADEVLDSPNSLVQTLAKNRTYATQAVLKNLLLNT